LREHDWGKWGVKFSGFFSMKTIGISWGNGGVYQQDHGKNHGNVDLTALYGQRMGNVIGI